MGGIPPLIFLFPSLLFPNEDVPRAVIFYSGLRLFVLASLLIFMRSFGCQHTDVVFNRKHTVADGISNGNANGPFRYDFTSLVYLLCTFFPGSKYEFFFSIL